MIFVQAADWQSIILMLSEKDVLTMRKGHTVFVDDRQTGGIQFSRVVLSLHKDNDAALEVIRRSGHQTNVKAADLPIPQPRVPVEEECQGCFGIKRAEELYRGKCVICWYDEVQRLRTQGN